MSTIQQQLEAVGHQLTVDGIEFNAEFYEADHDGYYFLIGRKKVQIFWELETSDQTQFNKWIMKYGAIFGGTPLDVHFTATTIEAACGEALRLCREKVSDLAVAFGMVFGMPDINKIDFLAMRKKCNLTLRKVEDATGISNPYLSQLETGQIKSPSYTIVKTLMDFYNTNHNQPTGEKEEKE